MNAFLHYRNVIYGIASSTDNYTSVMINTVKVRKSIPE